MLTSTVFGSAEVIVTVSGEVGALLRLTFVVALLPSLRSIRLLLNRMVCTSLSMELTFKATLGAAMLDRFRVALSLVALLSSGIEMITFCGAPAALGVKLRVVGDTVKTVPSLLETVMLTVELGTKAKPTLNIPLLPSVTAMLVDEVVIA